MYQPLSNPSSSCVIRICSRTLSKNRPYLNALSMTAAQSLMTKNKTGCLFFSSATATAEKTPSSSSPRNSNSNRPFKDKKTSDLINSYMVFKLCGISPLVSATPTLIETAKKLRLSGPVYAGIKNTFFKHFCGKTTFFI